MRMYQQWNISRHRIVEVSVEVDIEGKHLPLS